MLKTNSRDCRRPTIFYLQFCTYGYLRPAALNVTTFGCPLIEYGQQYFMDLQTGTTADNLYAVTNITHTLGAGKFDTSFSMTFCSNGTVDSFRTTLAKALPKLRSKVDAS